LTLSFDDRVDVTLDDRVGVTLGDRVDVTLGNCSSNSPTIIDESGYTE